MLFKGNEQHMGLCHMILQHRAEREDQLMTEHTVIELEEAWMMLVKLQRVSDRSEASCCVPTALLCEWLRPLEASRDGGGSLDCPSTTPSTPECQRTRRAPRETGASGSWSPPHCCSL